MLGGLPQAPVSGISLERRATEVALQTPVAADDRFTPSWPASAVLLACAALSVYLAAPAAMSHDGAERYGYFAGAALVALVLPLLGGWLTHRFGNRDPNWMVIAIALMSVGARLVDGVPSTEELRAKRALEASTGALEQARAGGDVAAIDEASLQTLDALEQLANSGDKPGRGVLLAMTGFARDMRARMDRHEARVQAFNAAGGCDASALPSQAAIDARRVMLRPVRSSADDLCVHIRTAAADVEREILAANMTAEHVSAFKEGARLAIITEACASQVKLLTACDDMLALLAAQFGRWSFDADATLVHWDAAVPDEVVAAYERAVTQIDGEATTMARLEQLRAAPTAPK